MRKKFIAIFMVLAMFFINIPTSIFAGEVDGHKYELSISELSIHDYVTHNNTVYQGDSTGIYFKFSIDPKGNKLGESDEITVKTNIAEIFEIPDDGIKDLEIKNHNDEVLMNLDIKVDKNSPDNVVLVFKNFKNISQTVTGSLSTKDLLTAKNVGATVDNPIKKELIIGNAKKEITIKAKNQNPTETTFNPVDIDVLWKNTSSRHLAYQGATSYIEVNPIGSMDLYGSTTHKGRKPKSYKNFIVEDKIPEKGYIKEDTMQIYAAIPTLSKVESQKEKNGYIVEANGFYAKRGGTSRVSLLNKNDAISGNAKCLKCFTQNDGESYDTFKARIKATQLSWGIYKDTDGSQTFLCNFGNIGDSTDKNGILYEHYGLGRQYAQSNPEIFSSNGATGGNIVSYYIEFDAYFPDVEGAKKVTNVATVYRDNAKIGDRSGNFDINNGYGIGEFAANEDVAVVVQDEVDSTPIQGAYFDLQEQKNGNWITAKENIGPTNEKGVLKISDLENKTYKLIQTKTKEGYVFDNKKYSAITEHKVSEDGIITRTNGSKIAILVKNSKQKFNIGYEFKSKDPKLELPEDVKKQCPTKVHENIAYGEEVIRDNTITLNDVKINDGVWKFLGWDREKIENVTKEENFIGTWEFVKNSTGGGTITPKPEPEDPDRIEGGDRVDTSIDTSEELFPNGTDAVVLANCERYTDVLTANPFAIQIKAAALFTYKDKLPEKTLKEIERLGVKKIYISGGYDAVSKKVVDELINKGYDVFRFDGVNRYDTARKIAIKIRENGNKNVAELASGENYPDALSMTSMAVKDNAPILLTKKDSIPSYTKQALAEWDIETIKIAGLDEAISNNVEKQIKNGFAIEENNKKDSNVYDGAKVVSRFGGKDRYETSTVIAKESYLNSKLGVYATGEKFPDALIAGNYAGRKKAPVLLVKKDTLPESVKKYTANSKIEKATIIGGSKAVSDNVIEFIKEAIKNRE